MKLIVVGNALSVPLSEHDISSAADLFNRSKEDGWMIVCPKGKTPTQDIQNLLEKFPRALSDIRRYRETLSKIQRVGCYRADMSLDEVRNLCAECNNLAANALEGK